MRIQMGEIIKRIEVPKNGLKYFFIGGMNYRRGFGFQKFKNSFPFTTYYIDRVEDMEKNGIRYRSLFYCKLPLICLQYEDHCKCIEFELPAECNGEEFYPFIGLKETKGHYEIIFRKFSKVTLKEKENAWLGKGKKREIKLPRGEVKFKIKEYEKESWEKAVLDFFQGKELESRKTEVKEIMEKAKNALYRSYDSELGAFLQLPWKDKPGFPFSLYSYNQPSFESIRLAHFLDLYRVTGDSQYKEWFKDLEELFLNPNLYKEAEEGLFWHNMTHFNGDELEGQSYLGVGYAGYPGGQGTIARNLAEYLKQKNNRRLKELLKKNLNYILNTQNEDGSWQSAIQREGIGLSDLGIREWKKSEGATAENIRALLAGYQIFEKEEYKNAVRDALSFLKQEDVICRNVLRDIGIDEPEGFSAILALNAFLDSYKFFEEEELLKYAKKYAIHLLTYIYWYGNLKGFFHPITESITPRISPFETLMAVEAYDRLYKVTEEEFWKEMGDLLFTRVTELIDRNGGLCEGVFIKYLEDRFQYLSMEQTFATSELLHVCSLFDSYQTKEEKRLELGIEDQGDKLKVGKEIEINKEEFRLTRGEKELEIFMRDPYSKLSRFRTKSFNSIRRLKPLTSLKDFKYIFKGVAPEKTKKGELRSIKPFIESHEVKKKRKEVLITLGLPYHNVKIRIYRLKNKELRMDLSIDVKGHDLECNQVVVSFLEEHDETLSTNWTQGGIYKRTFEL